MSAQMPIFQGLGFVFCTHSPAVLNEVMMGWTFKHSLTGLLHSEQNLFQKVVSFMLVFFVLLSSQVIVILSRFFTYQNFLSDAFWYSKKNSQILFWDQKIRLIESLHAPEVRVWIFPLLFGNNFVHSDLDWGTHKNTQKRTWLA